MWMFPGCRDHANCEGCSLQACCPVVLDLRLHLLESERQEELVRKREWREHGTILSLNSPEHQQFQSEVFGT